MEAKLVVNGRNLRNRFMGDTSELHRQQKDALESVAKWFKSDETRDSTAVVVMPTGTGKSGVICCLPYYLGGAEIPGIDFHKPILVITPGLDTLDQLYNDLYRDPLLVKLGLIREIELGDYGYTVLLITETEQVPTLGNVTKLDIVLTNAQKWRTIRINDQKNYEDLPEDLFSVIIVDEAHHLPAKQWQEIIAKFQEHAKIVFFTATPNRADKKKITDDLHIVGFAYELSREDAIKEKLIRDVDYKIISTPGEPAELVLIRVKELMEKKNLKFLLPGGKKHASIIVTPSKAKALETKQLCTKIGFEPDLVEVVTSDEKGLIKDNKIKNIKLGKYEVVIIVGMLLHEGFDYPPFSIAGILTKIRSPVKFAQLIGKVQHLVREEGETEENIKADVITHEDFQQRKMIEEYENPVIPDEENKAIN